ERGDEPGADEGDDDGPHVPAGDVRGDRETVSLGRELLGQPTVSHRMLGRPSDPGREVGGGEGGERGGDRLGREAGAEDDAADAEERAPGDVAGQRRIT